MNNKKKLRILIVDDDSDYLIQMKMQLEEDGFNVYTVDNKIDAKKVFSDIKPDLAILDLMMQESDDGFMLGYEFKKQNPKIPIIMVSSVSQETGYEFDLANEEEQQWIKADAFLAKPVRKEQLVFEINKLIK